VVQQITFTVTTTGSPTHAERTGALPSGVTFVNNGNGTEPSPAHGAVRAALTPSLSRQQRCQPQCDSNLYLMVTSQRPRITLGSLLQTYSGIAAFGNGNDRSSKLPVSSLTTFNRRADRGLAVMLLFATSTVRVTPVLPSGTLVSQGALDGDGE